MRIKQFVIMMMIICGCVSAGCKNKEVQESDKTASDRSRLARQEVEYPEKEDTYEDWEQVGEFKINSRSVEQDVKDGDTSYVYIMGFTWPQLYDDGTEETCYYKIQTGTADNYVLFERNL